MEFIALKEAFYNKRIIREGEKVVSAENLAKLYPAVYEAIGGVVKATPAKTSDKAEKPVVNDKAKEAIVA